jgi:hypothetical protein
MFHGWNPSRYLSVSFGRLSARGRLLIRSPLIMDCMLSPRTSLVRLPCPLVRMGPSIHCKDSDTASVLWRAGTRSRIASGVTSAELLPRPAAPPTRSGTQSEPTAGVPRRAGSSRLSAELLPRPAAPPTRSGTQSELLTALFGHVLAWVEGHALVREILRAAGLEGASSHNFQFRSRPVARPFARDEFSRSVTGFWPRQSQRWRGG